MATTTSSLSMELSKEINSDTSETAGSSGGGADGVAATSPQRPTTLFTKFNSEATASSSLSSSSASSQDTSRLSPMHAITNATATSATSTAIVSGNIAPTPTSTTTPTTGASSPNSTCSSITSPSAFPPEMPQWKKDLIQRRKTNVARTIGAAASPVSALSAQIHSPTSPSSSLMGDHVADVSQTPTTPTKGAKLIASQYDTLTATAVANSVSTIGIGGRTAEQKVPKITTTNSNKLPATLISPTKSPIAGKSPTLLQHTTTGGHYTSQVEPKLDANVTAGMPIDIEEQEQQSTVYTVGTPIPPIPKQRSTLYTTMANAGKSNNHQHELSNSNSKRNDSNSIESGERADVSPATLLTTRLAGFESTSTTTTATTSTATSSTSTSTTPPLLLRAAEVFETQETETARKPTPSQLPLSSVKCGTYAAARQSHSKFESERTLSSVSSVSTVVLSSSPPSPSPIGKINSNNSNTTSHQTVTGGGNQASAVGIGSDGTTPSTIIATTGTVCDSEKTTATATASAITTPVVCGKISSKLQNNQFIKNQVKYQQQQQQQQTLGLQTTPGAGATLTLASPTSSVSPNKFASNNNKKKMVAVQEIKKTTPQHQHQHQHGVSTSTTAAVACGRQRLHSQRSSNNEDTTTTNTANNISDFDPSEDLSYGPGIVSKLRCRYLSLALRESMEKQRHCLDNLRRATSLNNLLDRNEDEEDDDEDEENGVHGVHEDDLDCGSDFSGKPDKSSVIIGGGILKRASQFNQTEQQQPTLAKKTAIYQKHTTSTATSALSSASTQNSNGYTARNQILGQNGTKGSVNNSAARIDNKYNKAATPAGNGAMPAPRHGSRHLKRGNDSLKRARSVEALLCEKTPWNYAKNRSSLQPAAGNGNSGVGVSGNGGGGGGGGSVVTIEDKIYNARGRLILGTDIMPPRRLTSIIDDTERPPPDLVKQTLKMFEASANRRPRGQRTAQGSGEVANKVANYKSIIKEQKPAVVFPKPPTSPIKKATPVNAKPAVKSAVVGSAELLSSPVGRKTTAVAAAAVTPTHSEMEKQLANATASTPKVRERIALSHGDNLALRHKLSNESKSEFADSPVTALTKKLEKLCIENEKQVSIKHSSSGTTKELTTQTKSNAATTIAPAPTADIVLSGNSGNSGGGAGAAIESQSSYKKLVVGGNSGGIGIGGDAVTSTSTTTTSASISTGGATTHDMNIENLRRTNHCRRRGSANEESDVNEKGDENVEYNNEKNNSKQQAGDNNDEEFVVAAASDQSNDRDSNAQAIGIGTFGYGTSSSDQSDDDECGWVPVTTKRVTKTALENIAKAGTTQQFKFANDNSKATTNFSNNKQILNGNTNSNSGGENTNATHQHQHQQQQNQQSQQNQQQQSTTNSPHELTNSMLNLRATTTSGKQIGVIRPLLTTPPNNQLQQHMETLKPIQQQQQQHLTSREIEKNRINEMKKTAANSTSLTTAGSVGGSLGGTSTGTAGPTTSLDTVINTNSNNSLNKLATTTTTATSSPAATSSPHSGGGGASGFSELDASNSPLWALRKKRQVPPVASAENTTMVFNFRDREKVPDYIENDGVIFRRKRVLPKPNESGFVRLPDLSLETSTDSDYDDFSMCPPSPCDVQFENANIVIDGKSSIRKKSKEATFRVQFNDTLTSTFEYPSEASLIVEDSFEEDHYANTNDLVSAYENLVLDHIDSATSSPAHHHHHVAVDEIIPLPTTNNANTVSTPPNSTTPSKNILGNLPLGSAPLGFYTPVKAPIDNIFQLGVTRAPVGNGYPLNANAGTNGSIIGIKDGLNNGENGDEPESLQYIKPANDDLTIAYSEGSQKTDLLY